MSALTFQDLMRSIKRKWTEFIEDEGHVAFPFGNSTPNNDEPREEASEDKEKFEELLFQENQVYKKNAIQELRPTIQKLKEGSYGYCDVTGKIIGSKRLFVIPTSRSCLNTQPQRGSGIKK